MVSEDVLRSVQWPTFTVNYKLEVLKLFIGLIANLYLIHCPRIYVKTALILISIESGTGKRNVTIKGGIGNSEIFI